MWCCASAKGDNQVEVMDTTEPAPEVQAPIQTDPKVLAKGKLDQLDGITFKSRTTEMTSSGISNANAYAAVLKEYPQMTVKLMGYASEPLPSHEHNKQLSRDRCRAAREYLEGQQCRNQMGICGEGKVSSKADEVRLELCDEDQVQSLEATAEEEDIAFSRKEEEEKRKQRAEEAAAAAAAVQPEPPAPPAPQPQVTLGFKDSSGALVKVQLLKRPLGVTVDIDKMPLIINRSYLTATHRSVAWQLG